MIRASVLLFAVVAAAGIAHAEDPAKSPADPHKMICKRETVTGSLADSKRTCHTREEWQLLAEQNRDEARRMTEASLRQGTNGH